jgi:RNA polymerase sigma-70 factor, ECF subfamily
LSLQAHPAEVSAPLAEEGPAASLDIAALTRRMAKADESAYRAFYDAYFHRLSRYLLVVTAGDEDAAREVLQATLVRVVRHIKPFADEGVFWSWLTVLARSALGDQTRKRRRYLAFLDRFAWHAQLQQTIAADEADGQLLASLEHGLEALAEEERDLVQRKYFARQPVREIAAELHASEKAVESRLVRVRRKLKQAMLEELQAGRDVSPNGPTGRLGEASLPAYLPNGGASA